MHMQPSPINTSLTAPRFAQCGNVARTMSSREIAELTGKRHDNVMRTIETLKASGVIGLPHFEEVPNPGPGPQVIKQYQVGKRDSFVVVAQLSPEFTAALVDRWQELEQATATPAIPQNLPEALRLAADLAEQNNQLRLVVTEQAPKVEALARIADARGSMCLTDAAKHLGVQRKVLIAWLRENRWVYRREGSTRLVAYQPREASGLLEHKVTVLGLDDEGEQRLAGQVRVTPKGLAMLAQKIGAAQ
ncbi:phage antirepressor KilAC domain-containing protein [Pseudomonas leptonychotis]|uniref:phage antirepressor KilAC domain-containing protein n=1 Tax=Pseudomonas leptonychotis TaxID=2448482 RepID=UPI0038696C48